MQTPAEKEGHPVTAASSDLLEHYESLVGEYAADLERRLLLAREASGDPYGALERMNGVLVSEIARLKVQLLDLDLKMARLPAVEAPLARPQADPFWPGLPLHGAGDALRLDSGILSHGFHHIEISGNGFSHRWAGPHLTFGLTARIDRSDRLLAEAHVSKSIAPDIRVQQIEVDGEPVQIRETAPGRLRFALPARKGCEMPTHIGFRVNRCATVRDVVEGSTDNRRVSVILGRIALLPAETERPG